VVHRMRWAALRAAGTVVLAGVRTAEEVIWCHS
jgi:hypothetical protein